MMRQNARKLGATLGVLILALLLVAMVAPCLVGARDSGGNWTIGDSSRDSVEDSGSGEPVGAPLGSPADWCENWDSYLTGQNMQGVGGWKGWDNNPLWTAYTSSAQAISTPNSIAIANATDLVHEYSGCDDGVWRYTAWQFVPSNYTEGDCPSFFILLNEYADLGPYTWASQVYFDGANNTVVDYQYGATLPLVKGQWVEILVEIDLDNDWQKFYYGGDLLYEYAWTAWDDGPTSIAAVDLFACEASVVYYDNLCLVKSVAVGGEAYPVNRISLIAPWIALAVAILAGGAFLLRRRALGAR